MNNPNSEQRPESEGPSERQQEFLASWNKSMLGGRPSIGLPTRGLRGLVVIAASVAAVVGVVLGGMTAVNAVANGGQDPEQSDKAALTSANLQAPTPSPTADPTPTAEPTTTRTKKAEPVRTRTVTETREAKESPKAKKGDQQTDAEEDKAKKAAKKAEKNDGTSTKAVGVVRNLVTGYCIDLPGLGAVSENVTILQTNCFPGKSDNQVYQTVTQADGTFLLRNKKSQWCLDVAGTESVEAGTALATSTCRVGEVDNQMFRKEAQGEGFYLVHAKSGLCLDPEGPDGPNSPVDTALALNPCSATDNQIWTFG